MSYVITKVKGLVQEHKGSSAFGHEKSILSNMKGYFSIVKDLVSEHKFMGNSVGSKSLKTHV